jgi:hypothetical protein
MNIRHILTALGAVALMLAAHASAGAQELAIPARSAKMDAFAASGLLRSANGDDAMVSHAIYVKLRKGYGGSSPAATVRSLASAAGLPIASSTQLAFTQVPLEKNLAARIQSMPSAQQARVAEAEDDLSRIIEVYYSSNIEPADAARMMARLPQVQYAEPIYVPHALGDASVSSAAPNDPKIGDQKHLALAKIPQAWDIWKGDTNTVIAIVDAGIDMFHEDLAPNIKENSGEMGTDI